MIRSRIDVVGALLSFRTYPRSEVFGEIAVDLVDLPNRSHIISLPRQPIPNGFDGNLLFYRKAGNTAVCEIGDKLVELDPDLTAAFIEQFIAHGVRW